MISRMLAVALAFAAGGATAQTAAQETKQNDRGSSSKDKEHGKNDDETATGERAGQSGNTGPLRPGFEYGSGDALAGGRTDKGPKGATGIPDDHTSAGSARKRANAAHHEAVSRKHAPQRADVDGAGDTKHDVNYAEPLREDGKRVADKNSRKQPAAKTEQPGAGAPEGVAGHTGSSSGGVQGPADAPQPRSK